MTVDRDAVGAMLRAGKTAAAIAKDLGCTRPTVYKVRREIEEETGEQFPRFSSPPGTGVNVTSSTPSTPKRDPIDAQLAQDDEILRRRREIAILELDARRAEAEERLERTKRSTGHGQNGGAAENLILQHLMQRLDGVERDRTAPANQMGTFVPLIQTFLTSMMSLIGQLVAKSSEKPDLDLSALQSMMQPTDALGSIVPLVKQVLDLANEIGGGGGESSELAQIIGALAPVLGSAQGAAMMQGAGAAPGARPPQPQQQRDPMQIRIMTFLVAIEREARARSDPYTVAELLERDLNICPQEFRELFQNASSVRDVLSGLHRFVPAELVSRISGFISQNQAAAEWLEEFIAAIQGDDGGDDDDAGEQVDEPEPPPGSFDLEAPPPAPDPFTIGTNGPQAAATIPPPAPV